MKRKLKIIDEIIKLHPSLGVDKGWSYYTGGMKDSGDWYLRKMLDVPIEELKLFLDNVKQKTTTFDSTEISKVEINGITFIMRKSLAEQISKLRDENEKELFKSISK
jgi:hypothetical protein